MKRFSAFFLALSLLISLPAYAAEPTYELITRDASIAIDGNRIHVKLTVGEWVEPYNEIHINLWSAMGSTTGSMGGVDEFEPDYFNPPSAGETVTATLTAPADMAYPAKVSIVAYNSGGSGKRIFDASLERGDDGKPCFYRAPVLDENLAQADQWVNFLHHEPSAEIQALSDEICAGAKTDMEKTLRIHDWVCKNIYYDFDLYGGGSAGLSIEEYLGKHTADGVLRDRRGVCSGYAAITEALFTAQRIPCITTSGYALGLSTEGAWTDKALADTDKINHAWNEVWVDGRWLVMDTTWNSGNNYGGGGYRDGTMTNTYFDPAPTLFALDHRIANRGGGDHTEPSAWAKDEIFAGMISFLYPNELVRAYTDNISREDYCKLMISLVEAATGEKIEAYLAKKGLAAEDVFPDTDDADVLAAYALGIVKGKTGVSGLSFDASGSITRQEAAVMLTNCAKLLGVRGDGGKSFADSATVAPWAADAVSFVSSLTDGDKAVMGDVGGGAFSPLGTYTREQALVSALRLFNCAN